MRYLKKGIVALAFLLILSPAYAGLGSQSFGRINFKDSAVTGAEILAAQTAFSDPGVLPGQAPYFLKQVSEGFALMLAFDGERRADLHLGFAKARLSEAAKLVEMNETTRAQKAIESYNSELDAFARAAGSDRADVLEKSRIVLGIVKEKAPQQAKPAIEKAINSSIEKKTISRRGKK